MRNPAPAQAMVEYGLLIALIACLVLLGATAFGSQVADWFSRLVSVITSSAQAS